MKKTLLLLLVFVIAAGIFAACNPKDAYVPVGFKRISQDNADHRFYVPNSWIADITTGTTSAYVSESDRSNVSFMGFEVDQTILSGTLVTGTADETESAPPSDTVSETVGPVDGTDVQEVPEISTVEEYWDYYEKNFALTFPDMTYSVKGENLLLSGIAAKRYVYTATVTGKPYRFMQVVAMKGGAVYIFTYTSTEELFDSHLEEVEQILGYLEIK